ncbi:MAG: hypothetical protein OXL34_08695 [Gemmatimonadota bacterium]|nr:hypothetical protein [Gemmatimonadota bacterium]
MLNHSIWRALAIAAPVALIVVPFGYAITGDHSDVLKGAGCGLAVGVGVGLRGGSRSGTWTGVLIGTIVGIATSLIAGHVTGFAIIVPPALGLAVGLIDGLRGSSLSGYRDISRETFIASALLTLGLLPVQIASGGVRFALTPLGCMPWMALIAGLLCHRREGWRDPRPPRLLVLGAVATLAPLLFLMLSEEIRYGRLTRAFLPILQAAGFTTIWLVALSATAFLLGRVVITWLQPRLRVYGHLADYLRVMWVPIGGFAVGYLTIIVVFAGFYGMLERFQPGAFAGAGGGITEWLSFSFFNALAQDYANFAPASVGARVLVGAHLILSVGWALVLFAAVMSSIGPKLDRIARRLAVEDGEGSDDSPTGATSRG